MCECLALIHWRVDCVEFFFFQAEDGIRDLTVTGVQTCALPISAPRRDVDMRHVRDGRGGARGRAEARARALAEEDVGRCGGRSGGWAARGAGVRRSGPGSGGLAAWHLATGDGWRSRGGGGPGGRRRRVAAQAGGGRQGLFVAHPRSRRRARSARFAVLRAAAHGRTVPTVRRRMSIGVAILGSTGSIGCSTLQVLGRQRDRFRVAALTAHSNADLLQRQAAEWKPAYVGLVNGGSGGGG